MHTLFWAQLKILAEFINRIWGSLHLPLSCPRLCLDFPGAVVAPNSGFLIFQTRKKKKKKTCEFAVVVLCFSQDLLTFRFKPGEWQLTRCYSYFLKKIFFKKLLLSSVNYMYIAVQKISRTFHFVRLKALYS